MPLQVASCCSIAISPCPSLHYKSGNLLTDHLADVQGGSRLSQALINPVTMSHGRAETVHMLIQAGAAVHATNRSDYTPLHNACYNAAVDCVLPLLAAGASVNAPSNPAGWWPGWSPTPLDIACRWPHWGRRNREIWALLLRAGATIKPAESLPGGTIYPPYMRKIIDAGGFKAYEKASCKSFMALLAPKLPYHLPPEVVEIVVMFSFHVGFY